MSKNELYKANYMQIPVEISEDTLDELEKHCKKMIDYERGRRGNEHSNVLQLINNYRDMQEELQLKDKVIEEMVKFIANQDVDEEICSKIKNPTSEESDCYADIYVENACKECVKEYFENKVKGE